MALKTTPSWPFAERGSPPVPDGEPPRVALFTPLPPAPTGTADYAAELVGELGKHVALSVFETPPPCFDSSRFDAIVYQFANNRWHAPFCEFSRRHPGIAVLHETDLSHLFEVSGQPGHRFLMDSKAFVVHSRYAAAFIRGWGFNQPVSVIPHGVRIGRAPRAARRASHNDENGIVVGILGFPGAHKNLPAAVRAFEFLAHRDPSATCWISGDAGDNLVHPGLGNRVRYLGYQSPEDFEASLAACDVVINLRRPPTNGETSGIMIRAFGLGRAVIVSDTGSFHELPDEICFKVPCDRFEQSVLNACLLRLANDGDLRREVGKAARRWAQTNCSWQRVGSEYAALIRTVFPGRTPGPTKLGDWVARRLHPSGDAYVQVHCQRFIRTLEVTPAGGPDRSVLEMGCTLQITSALREVLDYAEVRGCALGRAGESRLHHTDLAGGGSLECTIDYFDAERDPFPYRTADFDTVLCCELLEHLQHDPMQMLREINRVLKPGGALVLSTPNAASFAALSAVLRRENPGFYVSYQRPGPETWLHPRHAREYAPGEIVRLLEDAGFALEKLQTVPYSTTDATDAFHQVHRLAADHGYPCDLREACILGVARKVKTSVIRFPKWLYDE